jgi:sterol desaturase/sphingolipid hydroxylase (fatty acid hydroxylase superfamily)
MTEYAQILLVAIPFFLVLIAVEWGVSIFTNNKVMVFSDLDTISSLSSGMTNILKDVLQLSVIIISYQWFYDHLALFSIKTQWWHYTVAFILLDFAGYWSHRFEHRINILWNRHIIHHSSEEFNLACALRQNVSAILQLFTSFTSPCCSDRDTT